MVIKLTPSELLKCKAIQLTKVGFLSEKKIPTNTLVLLFR